MLYLPFRVLSLCLLALLFIACDSNDSDGDEFAMGTMEAEIDGVTWQAANANANRVEAGPISTLTIAGATASVEALSIALVNVTAAGTYSLSSGSSASFTREANFSGIYNSTSGSVTISHIDEETVEGTFSFEARNTAGETISVTNGRFDVEYGVFGSQPAR